MYYMHLNVRQTVDLNRFLIIIIFKVSTYCIHVQLICVFDSWRKYGSVLCQIQIQDQLTASVFPYLHTFLSTNGDGKIPKSTV